MPILNWLNRDDTLKAASATPYRLLEEDRSLGFGDPKADNIIVQGDNLAALKSLLPYCAGQVKCIFIDPPYNTRSAFEHYDDNLEHSEWLHMMYPRLELLRDFLREDGSIWMTIDDNEAHYLKVIADEIFGRKNFVANVVWQKKYAVKSDSEFFSESHDHIFVFAKNRAALKLHKFGRTEEQDARYGNLDNDPRGAWTSGPIQRNEARDYAIFPIISPTGKEHWPPKGTSWRFTKEKMAELIADDRIWFGASGNNVPRLKRFLSEVSQTVPPTTWWEYKLFGHNDEARREAKNILDDDRELFATPKPERLIERILILATVSGDLVMDSFLGSGTTAAVAHKMGRRYIGIEVGEHAVSHAVPRLRKVVEGEQGGISKTVGWNGGGGFRFFRLGEPVFDAEGQLNSAVQFPALAAHVWHAETGAPFGGSGDSPLLGVHEGTAYYLLYNGILGDKRPEGGNVLTHTVLAALPPHDGPKVIFGEASRIGAARLKELAITFRQIPYDIKVR